MSTTTTTPRESIGLLVYNRTELKQHDNSHDPNSRVQTGRSTPPLLDAEPGRAGGGIIRTNGYRVVIEVDKV